MSTTKKGDLFEDQVYELLVADIKSNNFIANEQCCRIYKKKGYYSRDRERDIVFDISVEIFLPGQSTFSILVLVECKNYNHRVPVDDVEEFFQKTQQISGANVKAMLFSNNSFQDGTIKFSKSKGIGLARYIPNEKLDWILTRSPSAQNHQKSQENTAYRWLRYDNEAISVFNFYAFFNNKYTTSLTYLFYELINHEVKHDLSILKQHPNNETNYKVEHLSRTAIESVSSEVLKYICYHGGMVKLDLITAYLQDKENLELDMNTSLADHVLGIIDFSPLKIKIDSNKINNLGRIRFTLAHELGHYFLGHSRYLVSESCYEYNKYTGKPYEIEIKDIVRLEQQANSFAASLLMPKEDIAFEFISLANKMGLSNRGFGPLFLDNQKCNIDNFDYLTSALMKKYGVSRLAVKNRLLSLGLLNNEGITKNKVINIIKQRN